MDLLTAWKDALPAYLGDLEKVVNMDSGTYEGPDVEAVSQVFADWLGSMGGEVSSHKGETALASTLVARFRGPGKGRILVVGHVDTVFARGEAKKRPFRREGDRAMGPGVADMKSGCLLGLYAVKELLRSGVPFGEITLAFNPDEEIGSPSSSALLDDLAQGQDAVFVLEPGRMDGSCVIARKAVGGYTVKAKGRSAHAGVAPQDGRSAILELCEQALAIKEAQETLTGLTFNIGHFQGGTRAINVVPAEAEMAIDVRATTAQAVLAGDAFLKGLGPKTPDVQVTVEGSFSMPPMETTPAILALHALAVTLAGELGFGLPGVKTGGGSDANHMASSGVPVLDGLGPVGGHAHSPEEYILLASVPLRGALLTRLLSTIGASGFQGETPPKGV